MAQALCELSERLRAVVPDISIPTMAFHLQHRPWWLKWLDGCHGMGGDNSICYKVYAPQVRDAGVDELAFCAYDYYQKRKRWLPVWGTYTGIGLQVRREFIEYNLLPEYEDHTEKWEDELVIGLAGHFCPSHVSCVDYKILDETSSGLSL